MFLLPPVIVPPRMFTICEGVYWQKTPTKKKKSPTREQGESFPSKERRLLQASSLSAREQGKVLRVDSVHARAVFLLAGHNIAPGAEMQDKK